MSYSELKIGFIGAGNMAEAMIEAVICSKFASASKIIASDINQNRLDFLSSKYGILTENDNFKIFSVCKIVVLAVKPQQVEQVLSKIAKNREYSINERKLVISIAAGITIEKIEDLLYLSLDESDMEKFPIIRVMPNTPALVLEGMAGMSSNKYVDNKDLADAKKILGSMGKVIEFDEKDLDAVTALSGSGPAYVFYLIESMIEGGINVGLNPDSAKILTLATLKGSVKLIEKLNESPEILRNKVTSPGGTTEAALKVFEANDVKQNIIKAILAAASRSKELSTNI